MYFQIASGFASSVANGVVNAIQNAVTNVAMNITVRASDPRVRIINHSGTQLGVKAGQTASFDIEFIGDGAPHRFDLQFVREGTNVVLGSIPVVIGTPIPGDGYHFEDLEEGEIEIDDDFGRSASSSTANVAPSFTAGASVNGTRGRWNTVDYELATNITAGPTSESWQVVDFQVTVDHPELFTAIPSISADGTLSFTYASNAFGSALISVVLHDNGGTANGGVDTSAAQTITISATAVNDAPSATNDSYSLNEGQPLTVIAPGALMNDSDVENDPLSASWFRAHYTALSPCRQMVHWSMFPTRTSRLR